MTNVKKDIKRMASQLGRHETVKLLVAEGVSPRISELLSNGTYKSEPKAIRDKLISALNKAGFLSSDEKAS